MMDFRRPRSTHRAPVTVSGEADREPIPPVQGVLDVTAEEEAFLEAAAAHEERSSGPDDPSWFLAPGASPLTSPR